VRKFWARIEPSHQANHDLRTFECVTCDYCEIIISLGTALVTSVSFATLHISFRALAAIGCERPTDVVLRFGELAALAPNVALVTLVGFDLSARHGLVPEEKEQNDDRDWNAEQPEKCTSSHSCLRCCS
jgi:hypothetical protein